MPNMTIPNMQMSNINIPIPGLRGSTQAGGRSFGFARFSNERVSTVNIERSAGNLERGEQVDQEINSMKTGVPLEKVTNASTDLGFANVTYDIIGVISGPSSTLIESEKVSTSSKDTDVQDLPNKDLEISPAKPTWNLKTLNSEPIYDDIEVHNQECGFHFHYLKVGYF